MIDNEQHREVAAWLHLTRCAVVNAMRAAAQGDGPDDSPELVMLRQLLENANAARLKMHDLAGGYDIHLDGFSFGALEAETTARAFRAALDAHELI